MVGIAIACPITGDWVAMTNHTWAFSIAEIKKNLGFSHLEIINDFTAASMAIPMLKKIRFSLVAQNRSKVSRSRFYLVPERGLGLRIWSMSISVGKACQASYVDFAPNSEEEAIILEILRAEIGHVFRGARAFWPWAGEFVSRNCAKLTTACQKISSQKILPNARWLTAAPDCRRAVLRHYGPFWRQSGAQSGHLAACLLRAVSCRASLSSSKPPVSVPHLKIKGALKNMSMRSRCISSSMTIRAFSVPVHIYARP